MMTPMVSAMALMVVAAGSAHVHPHTGPSACTSVAMAGSTIWCKFFLDFALSRQAHNTFSKGKAKVESKG